MEESSKNGLENLRCYVWDSQKLPEVKRFEKDLVLAYFSPVVRAGN